MAMTAMCFAMRLAVHLGGLLGWYAGGWVGGGAWAGALGGCEDTGLAGRCWDTGGGWRGGGGAALDGWGGGGGGGTGRAGCAGATLCRTTVPSGLLKYRYSTWGSGTACLSGTWTCFWWTLPWGSM